jgi:hypothetical protein
MDTSSRFRTSRPRRRAGIPPGWSTTNVTGNGAEPAALFECAANHPYDGNEAAWDQVLEILGLSLSFQPAIAKILGQGRWRSEKTRKPTSLRPPGGNTIQ